MTVILFFVLARDRFMRLDQGAVLNLFPSQVYAQDIFGQNQGAERMGREQHLQPRQPGTRVRDHIANPPVLVVKVKILDVPDFAIRRSEFVPV